MFRVELIRNTKLTIGLGNSRSQASDLRPRHFTSNFLLAWKSRPALISRENLQIWWITARKLPSPIPPLLLTSSTSWYLQSEAWARLTQGYYLMGYGMIQPAHSYSEDKIEPLQ